MANQTDYDVLVVGAGFGGIYQSYTLTQLGLTVKVIDEAGDVGGTWYWNRYPGAMSDTESYLYRYTWDKEDLQNYPWSHHYVKQVEILKYLNHVVSRHDLRKLMQFETMLKSAAWDEANKTWECQIQRRGSSDIDSLRVRYLVTALGLLSKQNVPDFPGLQSFRGQTTHTGAWRQDIVLDASKRVAVIGSGSTGVQVVTELASKVKHLTSFQRNPQYSVPSGDGPVDADYREKINAMYDAIVEDNKKSICGFGLKESTRPLASYPPEQRQQIFEDLWKKGNGFRFMFEGFNDITFNREANEAACKFIKSKILQIVNDPEKARKLMPTELYARRPLCDGGYYNQFNRESVDVVSLKETPISTITPNGILTVDGKEHVFDVIIFATGFDAIEGNYTRINIKGRNGKTLQQHWAERGPRSYLGVTMSGFPNFFIITGPQGPFCNIPSLIETHVEFITDLIAETEKRRQSGSSDTVIEAAQESENEWVALCEGMAEGSLFKETQSWIFGANIPGKTVATRFYFGGLGNYRNELHNVLDGSFRGYYFAP